MGYILISIKRSESDAPLKAIAQFFIFGLTYVLQSPDFQKCLRGQLVFEKQQNQTSNTGTCNVKIKIHSQKLII